MKNMLMFSYFFAFSMMLFSTSAYGYIDPAALTYVIQVIAGVFIAGGAAIGIYWSKIKRFFKNKKNKKR